MLAEIFLFNFPPLILPVNHFITTWDNETELQFPHHSVYHTMNLNYLFTLTEPLPNHRLRHRRDAVHVGGLSYCSPRDKQKASLNKAALAWTTQLLEPEHRLILINHNYINSCICIRHHVELHGIWHMPSGCDSDRKGTSALAPGNQAEWWDSRFSQPGEQGKKQRLLSECSAISLESYCISLFIKEATSLLHTSHLSFAWSFSYSAKCCAPPLNWQSQRLLPAGQHSKFTALTPCFDNTKPNASAKFPITIVFTFLSPYRISAELQKEGSESQWQTHCRALKSTYSFNLWYS